MIVSMLVSDRLFWDVLRQGPFPWPYPFPCSICSIPSMDYTSALLLMPRGSCFSGGSAVLGLPRLLAHSSRLETGTLVHGELSSPPLSLPTQGMSSNPLSATGADD